MVKWQSTHPRSGEIEHSILAIPWEFRRFSVIQIPCLSRFAINYDTHITCLKKGKQVGTKHKVQTFRVCQNRNVRQDLWKFKRR
jgi:hypothetical protein